MRHSVPYKGGQQSFRTDAACTVIENRMPVTGRPGEIILGAMARPLASPSFKDFASDSRKLVFVLCDGTRPTPTALVLKAMHHDIRKHAGARFVIATGTHRAPTEHELGGIFGALLDELRPRISVHDARDSTNLEYLGKTSRGTPVSISRTVMEADGIVTINSVEPHYFAGFTGGRKSFLPGVAGYESIERNHSHAAEPSSEPLALAGNPVSEDMEEAFGLVSGKRIFSVQTVTLPDGSLFSAYAGNLKEAFNRAVADSAGIYSVEVGQRFNIVVTAAPPPMDRDLYQAQKAMEHARLVLEPGGIMILVASCWDGIGDRGFYDLLASPESDRGIDAHLGAGYRLGNHKAARWLTLAKQASLWAVTELDERVLRTTRMRGFRSVQDALDDAVLRIRSSGREPTVGILPGGSYTVPRTVMR